MKLGLGFYRRMLTPENFRFARQLGCTHIVAHWTDYFKEPRIPGASSTGQGWGVMDNRERPWTLDELTALRKAVNDEGLELAAIENFDPSHWHDVLLDGPEKLAQLERLKETIRIVGQAGIPIMGCNFSIAGVWGHVVGSWARGGAESVAFLGPDGPEETPVPNGMQNLQTAAVQLGAAATGIRHDLADLPSIPPLVERVEAEIGPLDILVNNARQHLKKQAIRTSDAELAQVLGTHLSGTYALTRECATRMMARGQGSIIMIVSMAALFGIPLVSAYSAAKAGWARRWTWVTPWSISARQPPVS